VNQNVNRGEAGHNYQADGTGRHYDGSTEASPYGGNQAYGSGSQAYGGGGGYTSGAAGYEAGDYTAGGYSQPVPDAGTGYGPPPSTANSGYTQPDTYQSYSKPGDVFSVCHSFWHLLVVWKLFTDRSRVGFNWRLQM